MGLYLLNISVDTADPNPENIPEDLSFNDQESIIELVLEGLLGFEDVIKEYDDHDSEDYSKKKNIQVDLLVYATAAKINDQNLVNEVKEIHSYHVAGLAKGFNKIDSPPPKI